MEEDKIEERFEREKKNLKIKWIFLTIIITLFASVLASEFTLYYYGMSTLDKDEAVLDAEKNIDIIADTLKNFRTVIDQIYIGEIDEQKILDETIRGYVKGLDDEYSEYMTQEEVEDYMEENWEDYPREDEEEN